MRPGTGWDEAHIVSEVVARKVERIQLLPFLYGAGLNLFSNPLTSFFMHSLGAYTVDRRKADPLHRETLKEYATVALEGGGHNLFFPGGTRSRSGEIESRVKLGLLGGPPSALRGREAVAYGVRPVAAHGEARRERYDR